ncbi:Crp/Fnr family transcriptional regulator [Flavivirga spongiicola]|uniref:Crp/Fnr family transcriptional regulator n=1 Tax=Flavivirga spongiicola TaxID=421621 RepID=A0ABU7XXC2_9FLAO|nr:Crp/Fnr family transcriptional regulator [Flavivirga sp. MEBiC05379]MDO5980407.1 Crp/Fnr family transcriptional regulator [Flavivirga sp. MEBiC05379]
MDPNVIFLNSFLDVSEETFNKLASISTFKKIEKGVQIDRPGEIPSKIYMLVSGIIRAYLSSETGKEFNKNFFMPFSFVGSLTALIKKAPSKLTYETLTACKVYEVNFEEITKLCSEDIHISNLYSKVLERIFIRYEERQLEFISMDATERYLKLRKKISRVDDLIPQYHIASYLSITPVQLSRIRKKIDGN